MTIPIVLSHSATAEWCKAVDDHHATTERELAEAREENDFLQAALSAFEWQRINALSHEEVKKELLEAGYTQERLDEGLKKIRATVEKALAAREGSK